MCCRKYKKHDDLKSVEKDVVTSFIKDEAESSSNDCDADIDDDEEDEIFNFNKIHVTTM